MANFNSVSQNAELNTLFINEADFQDKWNQGGTLWTWGYNTSGQGGIGVNTTQLSPTQVAGIWKSICVGSSSGTTTTSYQVNSGGIKADQSLWMWGAATNGINGTNNATAYTSPVQTVMGGTWLMCAVGNKHAAAIRSDSTLWTWGNNANGQLGTNNATARSSPGQTIAAGYNWKYVSAGYQSTHAIKSDGTLWAFGVNGSAQLGDGSTTIRSSPVNVSAGLTWKYVHSGGAGTAQSNTFGITTSNDLYTWGSNISGVNGNGLNTGNVTTPQLRMSGVKNCAVGAVNGAAIKLDGTLWTWGANAGGQLGDGTIVAKSSPVQIFGGGTGWKQVVMNNVYNVNYHMSAIKTDGTLWGWGYFYGLGNPSISSGTVSQPIQTAAGGTNWRSIGTSGGQVFGIYYLDSDMYPQPVFNA